MMTVVATILDELPSGRFHALLLAAAFLIRLAASFCDDRRTAPGSDERSYRALSSEDVGSDRKPPLAVALSGERRHRARRRSSDEHHPLFRKFTHAVPLAVDAVARAFA